MSTGDRRKRTTSRPGTGTNNQKPLTAEQALEQALAGMEDQETEQKGARVWEDDDFIPRRRKRKRGMRALLSKLIRRPGKWQPGWQQKILLTVGYLALVYFAAGLLVGLVGSFQAAVTSPKYINPEDLARYEVVGNYMGYAQQKFSTNLVPWPKSWLLKVEHLLVLATGWLFTGFHWKFEPWVAFTMRFSLLIIALLFGIVFGWQAVSRYREAEWHHNEKEQWIYIAWHALPEWKISGAVLMVVLAILRNVPMFRGWLLKVAVIAFGVVILRRLCRSDEMRRLKYRLEEAIDFEKLMPEYFEQRRRKRREGTVVRKKRGRRR